MSTLRHVNAVVAAGDGFKARVTASGRPAAVTVDARMSVSAYESAVRLHVFPLVGALAPAAASSRRCDDEQPGTCRRDGSTGNAGDRQ